MAGSLVFTLLLILIRNPYVQLFNVSGDVRGIGADILAAFAILMPVKVQNMILGGGIIRSGGKTKYVIIRYVSQEVSLQDGITNELL
ncbi:hypothetical protein [Porcincola intestinalis]|uniref:Uncharacterized protein n=1 Tax=Porcincola intestinalis TaxID=2606632 RepID=A0A6L5X2A8_9FIRM|nr:hypothetical protein [Porcincola intestinalis]MSS13607.1 hypothetical protein [Porcincola intestinalis]